MANELSVPRNLNDKLKDKLDEVGMKDHVKEIFVTARIVPRGTQDTLVGRSNLAEAAAFADALAELVQEKLEGSRYEIEVQTSREFASR